MTNTAASRRYRKGLIWIAGLAVAFLACVALVPTTVALSGAQTTSAPAGWQLVDLPAETLLTVEKGEQGSLALRPQLEQPEVFDSELISETEGFVYDAATGIFRAGPGAARLALSGDLADFSWLVDPTSTSTDVTFTRTGGGSDIVERPVTLPPRVDLVSPDSILTHSSSYAFRSVPIPGASTPDSISVNLPGRSLDIDPASTEVSAGQLFLPSMRTAAGGWLSFIAGLILLWLLWAVGRALDSSSSRTAPAQMLRAGLGFAGVAAVASSLSYVLPMSSGAYLVGVLVLAVLLFGWRRGNFAGSATDVRTLAHLTGWACIPAVVLFFPMLLWGGWFAGQYKTDLFFYGSITSLVEDQSLTSLLDVPAAQQWTPRVGFDYRAIDGVFASVLTGLTPVTTVVALTLVALTLFLLFAGSVIALSSVMSGGRSATAIAVLALMNPVFVGLFIENYYSHYWFVAFIPLLVLGVHAMWQSDPALQVSRGYALWATAAVSAVMLAVYPFFFVIAAAAIVLTALLRSAWRSQAWKLVWGLAWRTLIIINVSLMSLTGFFKIEGGSAERLDEIARYVLLSPYSPSQVIGLATGLVPYQWRFPDVPADAAMGFPGQWIWSMGPAAFSVGVVDVVLLVGLLMVTIALVDWKGSWASLASVAAVTVPVAFVAFGGYLIAGGKEYPALKSVWTAAALVALIMAGLRWRERGRWIAIVVLAAVSVFWIRSAMVDRVFWYVNPASDPVAVAHTAVVPDLMGIRTHIADQPGGVSIVYSSTQPLTGTDQARLIEAHTQILARDLGRDLQPTFGPLTPDFCESLPPATGTIVVAGVTGESSLCGKELVQRGEVMEVFQ